MSRQVMPAVAFTLRQGPGGRLRALEDDGLVGSVVDARPPLDDASVFEHAVVKVNMERSGYIFEVDFQGIAIDVLVDKMEHHVAVTVGVGCLQGGLVVQ